MKKRIKVFAYRKNGSFKFWFFITIPFLIIDKIKISKAAKSGSCYYCNKPILKGDRYYKNDYRFCSKKCMQDHYNEKHFIQVVKPKVHELNKKDKEYCKEHFTFINKYRIAFVRYNDWEVRI